MSKNLKQIDKKIKEKLAKRVEEFRRLFPDPIIWRLVPNYTKYEVSEDGRVRNTWTGKILKQYVNSGYYSVKFSGDGEENEFRIHRLVALAFHPNPNNLSVVDHIDNNKLNNHVSNLRWVTQKENIQSYNDNFRIRRKILQYDLNGNLIKTWKSMTELLEKNPAYKKRAIYHHIQGGTMQTYGFKWINDPPIIRVKPNRDEKFEKIGEYKKYDLSNYGVSKNGNIINTKRNILLSKIKDENGYEIVGLYCSKLNKNLLFSVHRLVAYMYIINNDPINKKQINHIDKNRSNNYYKNLEWVTPQENIAHSHGKLVKMINKETGEVMNIFRTVQDAGRFFEKISTTHIGDVCNGKLQTCIGYKWEWVWDDEEIELPIITVQIKKKIIKV